VFSLIWAMAIRVAASATYIAAIATGSHFSGTGPMAAVVYAMAVCYVASALGRIGTDQLISSKSPLFHEARNEDAASLHYSSLILSAIPVILAALAIDASVRSLGYHDGQSLPPFALGGAALAFALAQTAATSWQASGFNNFSVVLFPLLPNLLLLAGIAIFGQGLPVSLLGLTFAVPAVIGIVSYALRVPFSRHHISTHWLWQGAPFYLMGLSFYVTAWGPFTFLPLFLPANELLLLNVALRINSIQSLPVNAISSYLMPKFALTFQRQDMAQAGKIMRDVVMITLAFQAAYLVVIVLPWLFPGMVSAQLRTMVPLLLILSIGQFVNGMTGPCGPALLMSGSQKLMSATSAFLTILFIASGIVFVMQFGLIGFSICVTFFVAVQNLLYAILLYRRTGLSPFGHIARNTPAPRR
jgi:O-antigen/teichoic acid export membrane protein